VDCLRFVLIGVIKCNLVDLFVLCVRVVLDNPFKNRFFIEIMQLIQETELHSQSPNVPKQSLGTRV
jgi:hypothetical protein